MWTSQDRASYFSALATPPRYHTGLGGRTQPALALTVPLPAE